MKNEMPHDTAYFMSLPYTITLRKDEDGDFVGRIAELQGCVAHGATEAAALRSLRRMQALWIQDCIEAGSPVPSPSEEVPLPSGKWVQRVPRSLHRKLSETAKREDVSLNQLVTSILAEALGKSAAGLLTPVPKTNGVTARSH
jgi:antitoxin HicB